MCKMLIGPLEKRIDRIETRFEKRMDKLEEGQANLVAGQARLDTELKEIKLKLDKLLAKD